MNQKNKLFFIIIILFGLLFLTGCYNSNGIETRAYVIAMGLDKGDTNALKLSLQISILNNETNGSSQNSNSSNSTVLSVDCSTMDSGITLINSYISKKINLSHCKAVIISEELACNGVSDILYPIINNMELRPDCNIVISRCSVSDFLQYSSPIFESSPANYYELILNSSDYSGYVSDLYLSDFYSSILSTTSQACAILGGINNKETHNDNLDASTSLNGDYKADETPIESSHNIENMGTAVFYGDKLVGELTNIETMCHLIVTNELNTATVTIPDPFNFGTNISIHINLNKQTKNKVSLINNYPFIECKVSLYGNVLSLNSYIDLTDSYYLETLNSHLSSYLENIINAYLYKTSKDFKSDIANFGRHMLPQYLTWNDWLNSDWLNNYQNSFFKVSVDAKIQGGYLFTKF